MAELRNMAGVRRFRKTVSAVPSLFTTGNIFCGFYSVMESLAGAQSLALGDAARAAEHFDRAAINIGLSVLFDFLDGRIARMTGATSEFGLELDSLADVLSFGVAPALLAYCWGYGLPELHKVAWAVSFIFVVCGALRLARFNVQSRQPNPKLPPKDPAEKKAFVGMPTPASASLIASIVHFWPTPISHTEPVRVPGTSHSLDYRALAVMLLMVVACLSFLMVSTIRYSSLKGFGARTYGPRVLIIGLALMVLLVWFYSRWTLLIFSSIYASHGVLGKFLSALRAARRQSPAERATPEPDKPAP
jgi:CDP-diacylglycerol--serine O-phosphatidyltransferase